MFFYFIAIIACIKAYTSSALDLSFPNSNASTGSSIDFMPILTIYELEWLGEIVLVDSFFAVTAPITAPATPKVSAPTVARPNMLPVLVLVT